MSIDVLAIMEGWMNVIKKDTPEIKEMATHRTSICIECEHLRRDGLRPARCGKCGCPIIAKARSKRSKCPARKWEK